MKLVSAARIPHQDRSISINRMILLLEWCAILQSFRVAWKTVLCAGASKSNTNQTGNPRINAKWRGVRVTIIAVEKQKNITYSECGL